MLKSRPAATRNGDGGIFEVVARVEADEALERTCNEIGHA